MCKTRVRKTFREKELKLGITTVMLPADHKNLAVNHVSLLSLFCFFSLSFFSSAILYHCLSVFPSHLKESLPTPLP